jgi:hypothetical protein
MVLPEWASALPLLGGIVVGAALMLKLYHLIRFEAKLARGYFSATAGEDVDRALSKRLELPWSRYIQNGLTFSEFLKESEANPQQFKVLSCFIRLMGAFVLFASSAALLTFLILRISGFIR